MDALSDVLRAVRLSGAFFSTCTRARRGWRRPRSGKSVVGAMFPGSDHLISYHAILEGSCWCSIEGEPPIKLEAGDIVVLPHGDTHVLATEVGMRQAPTCRCIAGRTTNVCPRGSRSAPKAGAPAHFVCGFLGCDSRPYNPLLTALPRVIRVSDHGSGALGAYFRAALAESKGAHGRRDACWARISELMFVDVVRRYLETLPQDRISWLAGLRDPYVGRALTALHESRRATGPSRRWPRSRRCRVRPSPSASWNSSATRPCST